MAAMRRRTYEHDNNSVQLVNGLNIYISAASFLLDLLEHELLEVEDILDIVLLAILGTGEHELVLLAILDTGEPSNKLDLGAFVGHLLLVKVTTMDG